MTYINDNSSQIYRYLQIYSCCFSPCVCSNSTEDSPTTPTETTPTEAMPTTEEEEGDRDVMPDYPEGELEPFVSISIFFIFVLLGEWCFVVRDKF